MDLPEFRKHAHELVDWMTDYLENVREYPVKSTVAPGEILKQLPDYAPETSESFDQIMSDFKDIILPGMTHWQHPSFFAYFQANSSAPSVLAEMLTATLAAQCMSWQTSPAATELEQQVTGWLRSMIGLPNSFSGVIQDTASTATLCALLTAREQATEWKGNADGLSQKGEFTVYASTETHSSIEKAVRIAGLGSNNLRKIPVDDRFAMQPELLREEVEKDLADGYSPLAVIATIGTTGSTAVDPLKPIAEICQEKSLWLHVDAALAGTALLLPEMRWMSEGVEHADSFVFNPHKWMFTNFDCSAYFVSNEDALIRTFEILPEYLKTAEGDRVHNYRDWGIQLGRRFRALKLWFVIRSYGVEGLRQKVREHLDLAAWVESQIESHPLFELTAPRTVNLVCFRLRPERVDDPDRLNDLNHQLLENLNSSGKLYLTHTKLNGIFTIRMSIGQTQVNRHDVESAWRLITEEASHLIQA